MLQIISWTQTKQNNKLQENKICYALMTTYTYIQDTQYILFNPLINDNNVLYLYFYADTLWFTNIVVYCNTHTQTHSISHTLLLMWLFPLQAIMLA